MFYEIIDLFSKNYYEVFIAAIIMVSAIIVFIGALKPLLFDKIKNKMLRKSLLALSNIVFSFASVAVSFWINKIDFHYYLFSGIIFSVWTVFVYFLYENTQLRTLIHKIGSFTIKKLINIISLKISSSGDSIEEEIKIATSEIKEATKNELISTSKKVDKELENL